MLAGQNCTAAFADTEPHSFAVVGGAGCEYRQHKAVRHRHQPMVSCSDDRVHVSSRSYREAQGFRAGACCGKPLPCNASVSALLAGSGTATTQSPEIEAAEVEAAAADARQNGSPSFSNMKVGGVCAGAARNRRRSLQTGLSRPCNVPPTASCLCVIASSPWPRPDGTHCRCMGCKRRTGRRLH